MAKLFANCGDHDQKTHSAASDLDLHCLQITLLGVSLDYNALRTREGHLCQIWYANLGLVMK